jgi:hypothetical protein
MELVAVGKSLLARSFICHSSSTLEESGLATLADRIDTILKRGKSVFINELSILHGPTYKVYLYEYNLIPHLQFQVTCLVETSWRGDGRVVVESLATVHCPVVVAMVVDVSMAVVDKAVLAGLLVQSAILTLKQLYNV